MPSALSQIPPAEHRDASLMLVGGITAVIQSVAQLVDGEGSFVDEYQVLLERPGRGLTLARDLLEAVYDVRAWALQEIDTLLEVITELEARDEDDE